ncbi:MAG: cytochrome c [Nitratireductor sp.]|nr:cytochrome c [Nitratireductor sp.]
MLRKLFTAALVLAAVGIAAFWALTRPQGLSRVQQASLVEGDAAAGETIFWAGGCGSCHADKGAKGDDKKRLGGGHRLDTPAGIFVTPNISPDPVTGIGNWSLEAFANAMWNGVSPRGSHYYPAFPYASYARMSGGDVSNLFAFLRTLEPVMRENEPHELALPFKLRRGIGLWKRLFLDPAPVKTGLQGEGDIERGRYLAEGPGHCGECHTPRTLFGFGGMDEGHWLGGGPAPEGDGKIPNITSGEGGIGGWSAAEIASYLETGFTPDFDSVGGAMVSVQDNMTHLSKEDRAAIAAYLKAVPAVDIIR